MCSRNAYSVTSPRLWIILGLLLIELPYVVGCVTDGGCNFSSDFLSVSGKLSDAQNGAPVEGAAVGFGLLAGGKLVLLIQPLTPGGRPQFEPTTLADGSFDHTFDYGPPAQCGSKDYPVLDSPDQVVVIVNRNGCETQMTIDINADTVVDPNIPPPGTPRNGFTIELKNPISVPACTAP